MLPVTTVLRIGLQLRECVVIITTLVLTTEPVRGPATTAAIAEHLRLSGRGGGPC